jgi:cobalt-zinc-cadmium efflux system membrane fusion protein
MSQDQIFSKMKIRKEILFYFIFLAVTACSKKPSADNELKESFVLSDTMLKTTTFASATALPLRNEFKFYGKITADNNKLVEVFPVVGGVVEKVYTELGDYVNKGQIIATIRSTEVAEFEKELQDAKNDLLVAKNNYKVSQELFEGKLNSERDVLEAKSEMDKAESRLKRIEQTFSIYSLKPGSIYEVRAPISGFVMQKNINQDMQLRSDMTDNIFDIAQIDNVWAIANINESDIGLVRIGMDANVTVLSYPDKTFTGKVDKIFNIIDPETKAMKVRITLTNDKYLLKPEMRASIKISYLENNSMLSVPSAAIIFEKSKYFVMVYRDRYNIETRPVSVYRQIGDAAFIENGLKNGEKVITRNQLLIYDALND